MSVGIARQAATDRNATAAPGRSKHFLSWRRLKNWRGATDDDRCVVDLWKCGCNTHNFACVRARVSRRMRVSEELILKIWTAPTAVLVYKWMDRGFYIISNGYDDESKVLSSVATMIQNKTNSRLLNERRKERERERVDYTCTE